VTLGLSTRHGLAYHLDREGQPEGMGVPPGMFPWKTMRQAAPVMLVHGFNYDPWQQDSDNNPHFVGELGKVSTFGIWRRDLVADRPTIGLGWYSVPFGIRNLGRAVGHGRWNRYRWAWDLAWEAGRVLAVALRRLDGPVDGLCHSLGSRVVLAALAQERGLPLRNLVIMNGAELAEDGARIAVANPQVNITNLVVRSDKVLSKFGAVFAPGGLYAPTLGQGGLGDGALANWHDIDLDDPATQEWGRERGWDLAGDNPDSRGDHWFTYRHPGNRGLIRAALKGDKLRAAEV